MFLAFLFCPTNQPLLRVCTLPTREHGALVAGVLLPGRAVHLSRPIMLSALASWTFPPRPSSPALSALHHPLNAGKHDLLSPPCLRLRPLHMAQKLAAALALLNIRGKCFVPTQTPACIARGLFRELY